MSGMNLFARLLKVDEERRLIFARAVQEVPDRSDEIFDYDKSKPNFAKWSKEQNEASGGKSYGNIREMHQNVAAGMLPEPLIFNDAEKAIDVVAKVSDDAAWAKCLDGTYTGLSIGGEYDGPKKVEKIGNKEIMRYVAKPNEISLVDRPCIDTATFFEVQKADGSLVKVEFKKPATAAVAKTDPDLPAKKADEVDVEVTGTSEEILAFGKLLNDHKLTMADAIKHVSKAVAKPERKEPGVDEIDTKVCELLKADGLKPQDMVSDANAAKLSDYRKRAKEELIKVAARSDASPKEGKEKYGDVKFADEKNKKYPIDTEAHIRAAWNYINKGKNAGKYSADDVKSIKAKIVAAWKDKIDKDGPPSADDSKKAAAAADLQKGMSNVASLAYVIDNLRMIQESCESEAQVEGDESSLPDDLKACIASLGEDLVAMVEEEVAEIINDTDKEGMRSPYGPAYYADKPGDLRKRLVLPENWTDEAIATFVADPAYKDMTAEQFEKVLTEVFGFKVVEKAGARHGKDDMARVQKMHDTAVELGAACAKSDKADDSTHRPRAVIKSSEMTKAMSKIDEVTQDLKKVMDENAELKTRLKKIEDQPLPAKGVLRVVGKGQDVGGPDVSESELEKIAAAAEIRNNDGTLNESATLIKASRLLGGRRLG